MVTWTYGRDRSVGWKADHPNAFWLSYGDVQIALKRIRKVCPIRYFVVGEYGAKKGRSHWHVIFFFRDGKTIPNIHPDVNYDHTTAVKPWVRDCEQFPDEPKFWEHGFSFWSHGEDESAFSYCAKYLVKDLNDPSRSIFIAQSRKPLLGAGYFAGLAKDGVDARLSPQDLFYTLPGKNYPRAVQKGGLFGIEFFRPEKEYKRGAILYGMTPAAARFYCRSFVEEWRRRHGNADWPQSEVIDAYVEYVYLRQLGRGGGLPTHELLEIAARRKNAKRSEWWWHMVDQEDQDATALALASSSMSNDDARIRAEVLGTWRRHHRWADEVPNRYRDASRGE